MAQVLAPKDQWFVVHVLSGQENKVRDNIEKRVKTEEMGDVIFEVLVPTERVSEIKRGKKEDVHLLIRTDCAFPTLYQIRQQGRFTTPVAYATAHVAASFINEVADAAAFSSAQV